MTFEAILEDLERRTANRVLRADDPWVVDTSKELPFKAPSGSVRDVRRSQALSVEPDLS